MSNLNLPEGTKLFINESLCPYYKGFWVICRKLWNRKRIHSFFIAISILKFCFEEYGPVNLCICRIYKISFLMLILMQHKFHFRLTLYSVTSLCLLIQVIWVLPSSFVLKGRGKFLIRLQANTGCWCWSEANTVLLQQHWYCSMAFLTLLQFLVLSGL